MGLYASAELIWGIPVAAWGEDGEPTPFWDEAEDDWRKFEGDIEVRPYGHYENEPLGILTSTRIKPITSFDEPVAVNPKDLGPNPVLTLQAEDQAREAGLPVSFYGGVRWWLVASYG